MILLIDNYDSFTYNIVHYLVALGADVVVRRNDALTIDEAMASGANGFLISPGPGNPDAAGISLRLVKACAVAGRPLMGVCLGHQAIGQYFGGTVGRAKVLMHGKTSVIRHDATGVFDGLPAEFIAARYHSLVVRSDTVPADLVVNAWSDDGEIMGLHHRTLPIHAVQFHPESVVSEHGHALFANFLRLAREPCKPIQTLAVASVQTIRPTRASACPA